MIQESLIAIVSGLLGGGSLFGFLRWWSNYHFTKRQKKIADDLGLKVESYRFEDSILERYVKMNNDLQQRVTKLEELEDNCQQRLRIAEEKIWELQESLAREKMLSIVGIVEASADGIIREWNIGAQQILGYEPQDIIGQRVDRLTPPRFRDDHNQAFSKAVAENRAPNIKAPLISHALDKNGQEIPVTVLPTAWKDKEGNWIYAAEIRKR